MVLTDGAQFECVYSYCCCFFVPRVLSLPCSLSLSLFRCVLYFFILYALLCVTTNTLSKWVSFILNIEQTSGTVCVCLSLLNFRNGILIVLNVVVAFCFVHSLYSFKPTITHTPNSAHPSCIRLDYYYLLMLMNAWYKVCKNFNKKAMLLY